MDADKQPLIAATLRNIASAKRFDCGLSSESSGDPIAGPTKVSVKHPIKARKSIVRASGMEKTRVAKMCAH